MSDPATLKFAKTHEWVSLSGEIATVGISDFAVKALTDVVHLELPTVGKKVAAGETIGEIESVKAVSDLYSPVSGEIVEVNVPLQSDLAILSDDPYGKGWIAKIRISSPSEIDSLLSYADYEAQAEDH